MEPARSDGRVVVLGVGNVLTRDDALGPTVIKHLEARYVFPETVELVDGGTPGLDFLPYLAETRSTIVVDTVTSRGQPGELKVYSMGDLLDAPPPARVTPHQPGIREALMAAEMSDQSPGELVLIGVIPQELEMGTTLTEPVAAAVEPAIQRVVHELVRLGVAPKRRDPPGEVDLWWVTTP